MRDRLFRTTDATFHIVRCFGCGVEFLSPQPRPEELAGFYPQGYWVGGTEKRAGEGFLFRSLERYRRFALRDHVRFVRCVVEQQKREGTWRGIVDLGAGDGSFLDVCGAKPAVCLDISPGAIRLAGRRGLSAACARLDKLPLRAASFSVVTMFHVLEHLSPPDGCLAEIRRVLVPGGRVVIQVPNVASWQRTLFRCLWAGYDPPRHLINYSACTLRTTLRRAGFEVLRETHFSFRDNPTTLANSLAPGLYPPARLSRPTTPSPWQAGLSSLAYLALVLASYPLTLVESAASRGASVMVEARRQ